MGQFVRYLEEERSCLEAKGAELCADEQKDEGKIEKVKFKVYGMCLAIYQTVKRQCTPETLSSVYLKRLEEFPKKWEDSLEKAEEYAGEKRILVERAKLETLQEVRSRFLNFRG